MIGMKRLSRKEAAVQAKALVARMSAHECVEQLNYDAPGIERLGIPPYNYWNEGLHGVARAGTATVFPQAIGMAASFDPDLLHSVAEVIATEGRAKYNSSVQLGDRDIYKGLTYWSPNLNIYRDPRWGRGQETYGEDPYLTSRMGVAFIRGLQGEGKYLKLAAAAKHFAVHSGPEAIRHGFDARISLQELYRTYLPAFKAAVKEADVESVMTAYNSLNGVPCSVNAELINHILRQEWGFQGHVVTDAWALEDVYGDHTYASDAQETMVLAIRAGVNLCTGRCSGATADALAAGQLGEEEVREALEPVFRTRVRLGMFADDCPYDSIGIDQCDTEDHRDLSMHMAQETFVLLHNSGILPLDTNAYGSVCVVGPLADSRSALLGNYFGTPTHSTTILQGMESALKGIMPVRYAQGCSLTGNHARSELAHEDEGESEALAMAAASDLVVAVMGMDSSIEGEQGDAGNSMGAGDRGQLGLPGRQEHLLRALLDVGKPVVLLLVGGGGFALHGLEDHANMAAIMQIWYPGGQGGRAVAGVLLGETSPSGKLPITVYRTHAGLPSFQEYELGNRTYRFLDRLPLYPFGYGLTYSQTKVDRPSVVLSGGSRRISVGVPIRNEGDYPVSEVVQIYLAHHESGLSVPNWNLVAFTRVNLSPDEQVVADLEIGPEAFMEFDSQGKMVVDGDFFTLYAGISQPDARSVELLGQAPWPVEVNFATGGVRILKPGPAAVAGKTE